MSKPLLSLKAVQFDAKTAQETLQTLMKSFDANGGVFKVNGYLCCSSTLFKGQRTIINPKSLYNKLSFDTVLLKLYNMANQKSKENDEAGEVSRAILDSEYKIHLMPKINYIFPVMALLMKACGEASFASLIYQIKIIGDENGVDYLGQTLPRIVIFPSLGWDNAQLVLQKLGTIFDEYNLKEIAEDLAPRYSTQKNPLISYTQSSGDIKNIQKSTA